MEPSHRKWIGGKYAEAGLFPRKSDAGEGKKRPWHRAAGWGYSREPQKGETECNNAHGWRHWLR